MADTNGTGRLDRIEASLEKTGERLNDLTEKFHLIVDHHAAEFKQLMTWQVLMQEKMEKAEAARQKDAARLDARVDKLVSSIGEFIARIPPASLAN